MGDERINLVMLFANWYSGATLFTILANNHSQIVSNGETFPFSVTDRNRYQCSCGMYIDECDFYRYAAGHMRSRDGKEWDRRLFVQIPEYQTFGILNRYLNSARLNGTVRSYILNHNRELKNQRNEFLGAQCEFFVRAMEYSNATVYMDGMKSIRRAQYFACEANIDLKVVNLVRDGRAFCYSYIKNEGLSNTDLSRATSYWNNYLDLSDRFRTSFPNVGFIDIRYEDICRDQKGTLGSLYKFLNLEYQPFNINNENKAHILGNRMRKTFTGEIREHIEWKSCMSQSEIRYMNLGMQKHLAKYGYI